MRSILDNKKGAFQLGLGALILIGLIIYFGFIEPSKEPAQIVSEVSDYGSLNVILSDGLSNTTTTEDYLNDDKDVMTIYSADANILDGEEYAFNATIQRSEIAEDVNLKVTCTIPDKELSGVTADNIAEKTAGKIDLDYVGATSTGKHLDDNSVWTYVAFAEGYGSKEIQIKFDHEETYHDAMVDMDDTAEVNCNVEGVPFKLVIKANS